MIQVDTSFIIDLGREQARGVHGPAHQLVESVAAETLALSVFVLCELEAGAARAREPERERHRLRAICEPFELRFPDERFPRAFALIDGALRREGRTIATMDLLIATTAVVDEAALVTANRKHFEPISGLRVVGY